MTVNDEMKQPGAVVIFYLLCSGFTACQIDTPTREAEARTPGDLRALSWPTAVEPATSPVQRVVADNRPIASGQAMQLVWSEEFDGDLNASRWFVESGDGSQYGIPGWGNNELQWYQSDNASVEDGRLILTARRETVQGKNYTSARINTRDRFAFRYGRIEARIRLPGGEGLWPAFWLLPQNPRYGTWAASGEIDIVEAVNLGGSGGNTVHHTIHYGAAWPGNTSAGGAYLVPSDARTEFHEYALEWDEAEMRWYVDGLLAHSRGSWWSQSAAYPAPFDQPFYILLNVAVGGNWPGAPTSGTAFPVQMEVDYVRVFSGAGGRTVKRSVR